ncbi:LuxR C-terminal-related transcriptional regulator [Massilia sp. Bi118]|uniref:LuxR family transcriptional regulator n=1 Tax=Massilia sp. Bi118 TaxID=2822346 RepID=UPI001E5A276A|nr:LuxR C-terminal-related transcriptional regulator [Massilia sp. Bi118]
MNEVILGIYRIAQDTPTEEFQASALELVNTVLPFDSCRWGMALRYDGQRLAFESAYQHNEMSGVLDAYLEVLDQDLVGLAAATHAGTTINVNARQLCGDSPGQAAYLDYLCRFRHENMLVTGLVSPSNSAKSLSYYRWGKDDSFTERERQLCQSLFPHMMEALMINLRFGLAQLRSMGGAVKWPLAVCDDNGVILYAEPDFLDLLSAQWPARKASHLPAALVDALIIRRRLEHAADQVVVCVGLRQDRTIYLKARAAHAIDTLTPRELQVARLVAKGMNHKEIAIVLRLSPATVRNHLQRIHDRIGVGSNAELSSQLTMVLP